MTWLPMTQLAPAKMVNIAMTVTNTAAMRPIQRSRRVTNLESKKRDQGGQGNWHEHRSPEVECSNDKCDKQEPPDSTQRGGRS